MVVSFLPFPTRLLGEYIGEDEPERVAVTIYGLNLLLASAVVSLLWRYAVRERLIRSDIADSDVKMLTRRLTPGLAGYVVVDCARANPAGGGRPRLPDHCGVHHLALRRSAATEGGGLTSDVRDDGGRPMRSAYYVAGARTRRCYIMALRRPGWRGGNAAIDRASLHAHAAAGGRCRRRRSGCRWAWRRRMRALIWGCWLWSIHQGGVHSGS